MNNLLIFIDFTFKNLHITWSFIFFGDKHTLAYPSPVDTFYFDYLSNTYAEVAVKRSYATKECVFVYNLHTKNK